MPSGPFQRLWPSWNAARVLADDGDLVVVDKPEGISTHAPEAAGADAFSRVHTFLAARDGLPPASVYLGVHDRLDRDTSGVLLFTRRRSVNPAIAAQFEARSVRKILVAVTRNWPARLAPEGVLRHRLAPSRSGAAVVVARGGVEALTRYRLLERGAGGVLVELRPEGGRVHFARAQLAAIGSPVLGDLAHGGPPARRLMLHAQAITLVHPTSGHPVTYEAPLPREFEDLVRGTIPDPFADDAALDAILARAAEARWALAHAVDTDAFRLVNEDGDGLAGVTIDRYGDWLLVQFYSPEAAAACERLLDAATRLGARGVYAKFRPKQANILADTRREDLAPARALRGEDAPIEFMIQESGLRYWVRLGDGLSTGIFLDQRDNRRRVRDLSCGRSVLNLFAYTCPFTVAAAAGGASRTVSVDVSAGALEWGRRNLEVNGLSGPAHVMVVSDVFGWLEGARARRDRYDLVILDPPSYSTTKDGTRFVAESGYRDLAAAALAVVAPGGTLLACSNHRGIVRAKFRRYLHEALRLAGREAVQVRDTPEPTDFPPPPGRESHLKSALVTLAP